MLQPTANLRRKKNTRSTFYSKQLDRQSSRCILVAIFFRTHYTFRRDSVSKSTQRHLSTQSRVLETSRRKSSRTQRDYNQKTSNKKKNYNKSDSFELVRPRRKIEGMQFEEDYLHRWHSMIAESLSRVTATSHRIWQAAHQGASKGCNSHRTGRFTSEMTPQHNTTQQ